MSGCCTSSTAFSSSGARGFAGGSIFTADGRLVVNVVQEGLIRVQAMTACARLLPRPDGRGRRLQRRPRSRTTAPIDDRRQHGARTDAIGGQPLRRHRRRRPPPSTSASAPPGSTLPPTAAGRGDHRSAGAATGAGGRRSGRRRREVVATLESAGRARRCGPATRRLYVVEQDGAVVTLTLVARRRLETSSRGRPHRPHRAPTASAACSGIAFAADGARAWLNYTDNDGDTVVAEYPVAADGSVRRRRRTCPAHDRPARTRTTTAATWRSVPTACSTSRSATAGRAATPSGARAIRPTCSASCCAIDPNPSGDAAYGDPRRQPVRHRQHGRPRRRARGLGVGTAQSMADRASTHSPADLWIADVGQNAYRGDRRRRSDRRAPGRVGRQLRVERLRRQRPLQRRRRRSGQPRLPGVDLHPRRGLLDLGRRGVPRHGDRRAGARLRVRRLLRRRVWAFDAAAGATSCSLDGFDEVAAVRTGPDGELYVLERSRRRAPPDPWLTGACRRRVRTRLRRSTTSTLTSRTLISSPGSMPWARTVPTHRRIGDLELDAPFALVDHDRRERVALRDRPARPPRRGRAPAARPDWRAARRVPSPPAASRRRPGRSSSGRCRPLATASAASITYRSWRRRSGAVAWA